MSKRSGTLLALGLLLVLATLALPAMAGEEAGEGRLVAGLQVAEGIQAGSVEQIEASLAQSSLTEGGLLARLPLYFIENRGQVDERVAYYVQGKDKTLYFTSEGVTFVLMDQRGESDDDLRPRYPASDTPRRWVLKLDFLGANPDVDPLGHEETGAVISYFKGQPEEWKTGLKTCSKLIYRDLWPGIDLQYSGTVNELKYQFVVQPGADPRQIKLAYRGASDVAINEGGQLEVTTPAGGFHDDKPFAYQEAPGGEQVEVEVSYEFPRPSHELHVYGFRVGPYDRSMPLVLDPAILIYCGYIGGSGDEFTFDLAVDDSGSAYLIGHTTSSEATFPETVGPDLSYNGDQDAFVAKVRADGTGLAYCGYIGGSGLERGEAIAVDGEGNAYVAGRTESSEDMGFPVSVGPDLEYGGGALGDAFVAKVSADGTALLYCGYIGGSELDWAYGIAVDSQGSAYVAGYTHSSQDLGFPVAVGPDVTFNGNGDAFVAKVRADGTGLVYCGYVGGSSFDQANGIAVDEAGNAYLVGRADSSEEDGFPVNVGPDRTYNGAGDAFVCLVRADALGLVYCGYIGGSEYDEGRGIAVRGDGSAYVVGYTESSQTQEFPVVHGPDLTFNGFVDAFVAKVRPEGTGLDYCGYIGGWGVETGYGIAVDGDGSAYVAGSTSSDGGTFPVRLGPDVTYNGGVDAFVAKVMTDGAALDYCGYIGGSDYDYASGIDVDSGGIVYVGGNTASSQGEGFPAVVGPDLWYNGGDLDVFVAKVADIAAIPIGVAQDLSGPVEGVGWPQANAVQLAISETNAAGGVDIDYVPFPLVMVLEDSACDATQAVDAANALLDADAVAVVGHTCSGATDAAQALYWAAGVPMVSGSSSRADLTDPGYSTTFRSISRADAGAVLLATHLYEELELSEVAAVEWVGFSSAAFCEAFTGLGGTIISQRTVSSTAEYTATLTAIQSENPGAIYYIDSDAQNAGLLSHVAHNLGMWEVVMAWDSLWDDDSVFGDYAAVAGAAAERDVAGMLFRRPEDMPGYADLNADYQAAGFPNHGAEAGMYGAFAYDAARIIIAAIDRADSIDPSAIRDEIAATADYEGVVGTYEGFDGQGDVIPQWAWLGDLLCATPSGAGSPLPLDHATGVTLNADLDWSELGNRWSWINEAPRQWSLTENPGFLRIMVDDGPVGEQNLLVQGAPEGTYTVTTRVEFKANWNYQIAGLVMYQDADNYLMLGICSCDLAPPTCVGHGVYFDRVEGGSPAGSNYAMGLPAGERGKGYLRVVHEAGSYAGYYSPNGTTWTLLGTHAPDVGVELALLGLTAAHNVAGPTIEADFDYFRVEDGSGYYAEQFSAARWYDVYFGTAPDPPYLGQTGVSEYALPTLDAWTRYYWRVVAGNDCGETGGERWSFNTGANQRPTLGTVVPLGGSGPVSVTTYFTTTWQDADGWEDLKQCYFHIGATPELANNVTLMYNARKDKLWLLDDSGATWTGGHAPGTATTVENSQAILHCQQTTVQGTGDTLEVRWAIEFKPGFEGPKKTGLKCKDVHKAKAKGKWKGTWTIY